MNYLLPLMDRRVVCDLLGFDEETYAGVRRLAATGIGAGGVSGRNHACVGRHPEGNDGVVRPRSPFDRLTMSGKVPPALPVCALAGRLATWM